MSTTMSDADIHAFAAPWQAPGATPPPPKQRRAWPWVLAAVLGLMVLAVVAIAALLLGVAEGLHELVNTAARHWDITINGRRWVVPEVTGEWLGWALLAVVAACVLALLVVPLALLAAMLGVVVAVGAALLALAVTAAVALAPLWIVVLLLWLVFRKPRARTMPAA